MRPEDISQTSVRRGNPTLGADPLAGKESDLGESLKNSASRYSGVEEPDRRVGAEPPPGTLPGAGGAGLSRLQFLLSTRGGARAAKSCPKYRNFRGCAHT